MAASSLHFRLYPLTVSLSSLQNRTTKMGEGTGQRGRLPAPSNAFLQPSPSRNLSLRSGPFKKKKTTKRNQDDSPLSLAWPCVWAFFGSWTYGTPRMDLGNSVLAVGMSRASHVTGPEQRTGLGLGLALDNFPELSRHYCQRP